MKKISKYLSTGTIAVAGTVATFLSLTNAAKGATISGGSFQKELESAEISHTGTLSKFDSSLGILTSVKMILSGEFVQTLTATNSSPSSQNASLTTEIEMDFSIDGLSDFEENLLFQESVSKSFAPGETMLVELSDNVSQELDLSNFLSFFSGSGEDFAVSCQSSTNFGFAIEGSIEGSNIQTQVGCGTSIEYTFSKDPGPEDETTIPEPSMLLGILAVAGASALVRRKS